MSSVRGRSGGEPIRHAVEIHTEIEIAAPPAAVWEVLADLDSYPAWNPMIRRASGELRPGEHLTLHFQPRGRRGRRFVPMLRVVDPGCELSWEGRPAVRHLFESEHSYRLSASEAGGTHLDHDMVFWGLLVPPLRSILEWATHEPFRDQNRALKERAESRSGRPGAG